MSPMNSTIPEAARETQVQKALQGLTIELDELESIVVKAISRCEPILRQELEGKALPNAPQETWCDLANAIRERADRIAIVNSKLNDFLGRIEV